MQSLINQLVLIGHQAGDPGTPEARRVMVETFVDALLENFTEQGISQFSVQELRHVYVFFWNSTTEGVKLPDAVAQVMQYFSALPTFPRTLPSAPVNHGKVRALFH